MRAIASGFGLGGLDEAIEAFQNRVGDLAFEPAGHTAPMVHEGVGALDQRGQSGCLGVFHPSLEENGALVAVLVGEDLLDGEAVLIGLGRLEVLVLE